MSKIGDKMIEIEELLAAGFSIDDTSKLSGAPIDWVVGVDKELSGITAYEYQYEENENV